MDLSTLKITTFHQVFTFLVSLEAHLSRFSANKCIFQDIAALFQGPTRTPT